MFFVHELPQANEKTKLKKQKKNKMKFSKPFSLPTGKVQAKAVNINVIPKFCNILSKN